ncbi:MAG: hypothetical protein GY711_19515 [bacterium]|nr:hypothetical protein [bacterium]
MRGDFFGFTSALFSDRIAVGALRAADDKGRVYVFEHDAAGWMHTAELHADAGAHDLFGVQLELYGDTLMASDSGPASAMNHVYVFEAQGADWVRTQVLAPRGSTGEQTRLIALGSDLAVVGAPMADHPAAADAGAIYLFERLGGVWTLTQKVFAREPIAGAQFGGNAALSGNHMVVGEQTHEHKDNTVYFFTRTPAGWTQTETVRAHDSVPRDLFGKALALEGSTAIVAAPEKRETWFRQGAVYVFERHEGRWREHAKLTESFATQGSFGNRYGGSVALSGGSLIVGAAQANPAPSIGGQAFLYTRDEQRSWNRRTTLDGGTLSFLGLSVEIDERWLVVSAPDAITQALSGPRVFAWRRTGENAGASYCHPDPGPSGPAPDLRAVGSTLVQRNDLSFVVDSLPLTSFGVLLASRTVADRPFHGSGAGTLCLGDPVLRASGPLAGSAGYQSVQIPFDLIIPPSGVEIGAGETWNFQIWFRIPGPASTHTSTAVTVSFD